MCPRARAAIKFLVADGRYDYIETGSLISIKKNSQGIVIPSEERSIKMYPMDFEEFDVRQTTIRLSVGLEAPEDLLDDIRQALKA